MGVSSSLVCVGRRIRWLVSNSWFMFFLFRVLVMECAQGRKSGLAWYGEHACAACVAPGAWGGGSQGPGEAGGDRLYPDARSACRGQANGVAG
ncbi:Uncharacterised protein [Bordetella pertussis]|nr:Uncharacterised protein [Bordetella pertussis]